MKMFMVLVLFLIVIFVVACPAQPKSNYRIVSPEVQGTTIYHYFIAKEGTPNYNRIVNDVDYLDMNDNGIAEVGDTLYQVGQSSTLYYNVGRFVNDGGKYKLGVVAEFSTGYYSGMSASIDSVGTVPPKPGPPKLQKVN